MKIDWEKLSIIAVAIVSITVIVIMMLVAIIAGCKPDMRKAE